MDKLIGNEKLQAEILSAVKEDRTAHAYLLTGAVGSGKKTMAHWMSRALMCPDGGCGECNACMKIEKQIHPDVQILSPDNKNGTYSVDYIRSLRKDALVFPNEGRKKIYILPDAELMTGNAQDALLKILEEPPTFVVFILLCSDESKLLATILSRVVRLAMLLPETEQSVSLLCRQTEQTETAVRSALALAGGNIGKAKDFLSGQMEEEIQNCEQFCLTVANGTPYEIAAFAHRMSADKDKLGKFSDLLSAFVRDILMYKTVGEDHLIFKDRILKNQAALCRFHTDRLAQTVAGLQTLSVDCGQPYSLLLLETKLVTLCVGMVS